ncbi:MAG: hypothetical protein AAF741_06135 [Bacteroidota bacterium]
MIDDDYVYTSPKRDLDILNQPNAYPEYGEEAAQIITEYARKYKPGPGGIPDSLTELRIRDLLGYEHMIKRKLKPEARDYWIKVYMLLIDRDFEYEETLLEPSQRLIQ